MDFMQILQQKNQSDQADFNAVLRGQPAPSMLLKQEQDRLQNEAQQKAQQEAMKVEKDKLAAHALEMKKVQQQAKEAELAKDPVTSGIKGMFAKIFGNFGKPDVAYAKDMVRGQMEELSQLPNLNSHSQ